MLQHKHMERHAIALTTSGKVAWGKMAQVTNYLELDGCVNAVLLV
jgi:ribosome biogenesis protein NSA2